MFRCFGKKSVSVVRWYRDTLHNVTRSFAEQDYATKMDCVEHCERAIYSLKSVNKLDMGEVKNANETLNQVFQHGNVILHSA